MQSITLRVISGADRGHVFRELPTPITIGREEGNAVKLNDERVSRFHVKIQEDDGRLVVTDLDSTNGTRVNGHVCSLKILRYGDTISVGRTVLLVGSREQVADWLVRDGIAGQEGSESGISSEHFGNSTNVAFQPMQSVSSREVTIPRGLTPGQAAELRELLDHIHLGMRAALEGGVVDENAKSVTMQQKAWQNLLVTQSEIAILIRAIEDPRESGSQSLDTGTE